MFAKGTKNEVVFFSDVSWTIGRALRIVCVKQGGASAVDMERWSRFLRVEIGVAFSVKEVCPCEAGSIRFPTGTSTSSANFAAIRRRRLPRMADTVQMETVT